MGIQEQDKQFMIECLTKDLVMMLMEDYGYSMEKALSIVYNSHTYEKLEDEKTVCLRFLESGIKPMC